jgi:hypothetical protein
VGSPVQLCVRRPKNKKQKKPKVFDLLIFFAVLVSQFNTVKAEASLGPQLTVFLGIVVAAGFYFHIR